MGELKKYDGGVMFSDNDVCDVESLKVRFTPIQSGTGTPSPTNVMPISGYNRFNVRHTGKNVCRLDGWGANNTENYEMPSASNGYGTTVSSTEPIASIVVTQTKAPVTENPSSYQNGYFVIVSNSLEFDTFYNVSFDINIISNPLNTSITNFKLVAPSGEFFEATSVNSNRIKFRYKHYKLNSSPNTKINVIEVRNCGISCTISNLLITKIVDDNYDYEEYNGEEFVVDSPIVSKNLADIYGISATNFITIYSKSNDTNSYGTSIVVSENNNKVVITQSQAPNTSSPSSYQNGYVSLGVLGLTFGKTYKVSFRVTDIVSNPLNASLSDIVVYSPSGSGGSGTVYDTDRVLFTFIYGMYQGKPYRNYFEIRNCGMSCTLSDFMVTEADVEDQTYEPYKKTMYGGYIDFVKGEYVQEWACETDNGGTWYVTSGGNAYQWGHSKCSSDSEVGNIKSTHWETTQAETNEDLVGMNVNGALYIGRDFWTAVGITPTEKSVAAYFQAQKEAGTPLYCCCKLITPIHHPLTPLQLQTYAGINNIWCEANGEADIWRRNSKPISKEVEKSVIGDTYGIANFTTKSALPLEKCKVGFEFSQDLNGYSKPWAGGAGKNLYDAEKYPLTDGKWINTIQGESTSDTPYSCTLDYIPCDKLQGKTLTLNKRPGGTNPGVAFYSTNSVSGFISGVKNNDATPNTPMTFEVPSTANYMRFTVPSGATDIQIEIGETATSYEPYANVCPINGTNEFNVVHTGKNLAHVVGYSATTIQNPNNTRYLSNSYGTTISTIDYLGKDGAVVITQSQAPNTTTKRSYQNGYFEVIPDSLCFGKTYNISFKVTNITSNPLNATLSDITISQPYGSNIFSSLIDGDKLVFRVNYARSEYTPLKTDFSIYNCGMSFTFSEFMATPVDDTDTTFEPYRGETIPVKLPALGKNIAKVTGYSTGYPDITTSNSYTSISTTDYNLPDTPLVITSVGTPSTTPVADYHNGYFFIKTEGLEFNKTYNVSFKITDIVSNPLNATLNNVACVNPNGSYNYPTQVSDGKLTYKFTYLPYSNNGVYDYNRHYFDIRNCGMSCTISEFMVTEASETDTTFEPFNNTVYSGCLDMSSGELTLDWIGATRKLSQASNIRVGTNFDQYYFDNVFPVNIPKNNNNQLCSIVPYQWELETNISHFFMGMGVYMFLPHDFDLDTEFIVVGKPDNPITYQLTPQQITAFRGMNNIYQTASNSIEIDYKDMNHNELDLIGLRRGVLLNAPHTETVKSLGNVNFTSDMVAPLKECKIDIRPIQECNGYDYPWVGGGGKNLYDADTYPLTDGMWINGGDGTKSSDSEFACTQDFIPCDKLQGKTLTLNKRPSGGHPGIAFYSTNSYDSYVSGVENNSATPNTPMTFEVPSTANYMRFTVPSGATDIQIEEGSVSTSYAPYENICPISGTNKLKILHCGKNLLNAVAENELKNSGYANYTLSDGVITTSGGVLMGFKVMCNPNTQYTYSLSSSYIGNALHLRVYNHEEEPTSLGTDMLVNKENASQATFITDNSTRWLVVGLYTSQSNVTISNLQLELGDTATSYEKYNGSVSNLTFPPLGKNVGHIVSYSAETLSNPKGIPKISNNYGTTISTTNYSLPDTPVTITQTSYGYTEYLSNYRNGFFTVQTDNLEFGKKYNISLKIDIINNPMNASLSDIKLSNPNGNTLTGTYSVVGNKIIIQNYLHTQYSVEPNRHGITIYCCGMSFTMSEFMITEVDETSTTFEPFDNTVYGGYVDLAKNELVVTHNKFTITSQSVGVIIYNDAYKGWWLTLSTNYNRANVDNIPSTQMISDTFQINNRRSNTGIINNTYIIKTWGGTAGLDSSSFCMCSELFSNEKSAMEAWLDTYKPSIVYPLYNERRYQLSQNQLLTLRGDNNIINTENNANIVYWNHKNKPMKKRVMYNQMLPILSDANWNRYNTNSIDVVYNNNMAIIKWLKAQSTYSTSIKQINGRSVVEGNKYYFSYMVKSSATKHYGLELSNQNITSISATADIWTHISGIITRNVTDDAWIYIPDISNNGGEIGLVCKVKAPVMINLTQMFGAGNEPTVEEFEAMCIKNGIDLTQPLPYDSGTEMTWIF